MGAKGKVTSLVTKKDLILATRIEEAMRKNESLESITKEGVRRDIARIQVNGQSGKDRKLVKVSKVKNNPGGRASLGNKGSDLKSGKGSSSGKSMKKGIKVSNSVKSSSANSSRKASSRYKKTSKRTSATKSTNSKLSTITS
ncbi:DEAD-box ATP-dependent RNA helicase [Arachis hypogaea]|nr:DEAD-box ATP-dependent RNA helicase [Arachis hypogaea]